MKDLWRGISRSQRFVLVLLFVYAILSSIVVALVYNHTFSFGDQSLFYSFARNITHGEAIYTDFIHFRTPGSYFLYAVFIGLVGDHIAAVSMAIKVESIVLCGLVFLAAICLIFWKHAKLLVSTTVVSAIILLFYPAIMQLRFALALLAVAIYVYSYRVRTDKARNRLYVLTGVMTGLSFIFGQDMAILPIAVIGSFEMIQAINEKKIASFAHKALRLFGGFGLGVLPLLLYVIMTSNLGNFLYYTLCYAFWLQPNGMDVPYPSLSMGHIIFYLPILVYVLFMVVIYSTKDTYMRMAGAILLAFASVRMISMFGRSDISHLLFSIPELMILIPFGLYLIWKQKTFTLRQLTSVLPWILLYTVVIALSIKKKSFFVLATPLIINAMLVYGDKLSRLLATLLGQRIRRIPRSFDRFVPGLVLGLFVISSLLTVHILKKQIFIERVNNIVASVFGDKQGRGLVGGSYTSRENQQIVDEVQQFIRPRNVNSIFSYPIQPYFYSMARNHATRFMSFEPQTTEVEQDQAIADLQKNKPEVVVLDPLQAEALSKSVWKINRYVMNNYRVEQIINHTTQLWLMVPRESSVRREYPSLSMYHNFDALTTVTILQNPKYQIRNALLVYDKFTYPLPANSKHIHAQIVTRPELNSQFEPCAKFVINYEHKIESKQACEVNGRLNVDIDSQQKPVSIEFHGYNKLPVVWNDVYIEYDG